MGSWEKVDGKRVEILMEEQQASLEMYKRGAMAKDQPS